MSNQDTGATASLTRKLDNVNYTIFAMKEPDYVSKIMATYGLLTSNDFKVDNKHTMYRYKNNSNLKKYIKKDSNFKAYLKKNNNFNHLL